MAFQPGAAKRLSCPPSRRAAGLQPAALKNPDVDARAGRNGDARAKRKLLLELLLGLFLLGGLLCLFRLLRFLSHSILSGLNGLKRDSEVCVAEGQPSQHPHLQAKQIRGLLPAGCHLALIVLSTAVTRGDAIFARKAMCLSGTSRRLQV
jgi:hypothetical protein